MFESTIKPIVAICDNWFKHIYSYNKHKHINKQYITMEYDGIQKEAIRLIRICFPGMSLGLQSTGESVT